MSTVEKAGTWYATREVASGLVSDRSQRSAGGAPPPAFRAAMAPIESAGWASHSRGGWVSTMEPKILLRNMEREEEKRAIEDLTGIGYQREVIRVER